VPAVATSFLPTRAQSSEMPANPNPGLPRLHRGSRNEGKKEEKKKKKKTKNTSYFTVHTLDLTSIPCGKRRVHCRSKTEYGVHY
jgi:hypothetical protein